MPDRVETDLEALQRRTADAGKVRLGGFAPCLPVTPSGDKHAPT